MHFDFLGFCESRSGSSGRQHEPAPGEPTHRELAVSDATAGTHLPGAEYASGVCGGFGNCVPPRASPAPPDQGRRAEARDLLAPVNGRFTEGFETRDLERQRGCSTS